MLNIEALRLWMNRRGLTAPRLAALAGCDRHTVSRLLDGRTRAENVSGKSIAAFAAVLTIPPILLLDVGDGPRFGAMALGSWEEEECLARFYGEMRVSESVVTVNRRVASYLLPREMYGVVWDADDPGRPQHDHKSKWEAWADEFIETHSRMRRNCRFHQTVIGNQQTYVTAGNVDLKLVENAHSVFRSHSESTTLCLLENTAWDNFAMTIRRQILEKCYCDIGAWTKILIADDVAMLIRSPLFRYLLSYDRSVICSARQIILSAASQFANWDLTRANAQTDDVLRQIRRRSTSGRTKR